MIELKMRKYFAGIDRLLISFSGGRTSAYMAHRILQEIPKNIDCRIVFANTGQEDERTLTFVQKCEAFFNRKIFWVESDVKHGERKGTGHRLVNFLSASRDGQPFEEVIKKYGIPNQSMPHCTRELKLAPIRSLCKAWGWERGSYYSAIGIRADEIDRMSSYASKENLIYPLVYWKIKKDDVVSFWKLAPFDLIVPEHRGNCLWCWKKSFRKLATVYRENPEIFDFPKKMEEEYGSHGALAAKTGKKQTFFRGNRSAQEVIDMASDLSLSFVDKNFTNEQDSECAESCEVFSDTSLKEDQNSG